MLILNKMGFAYKDKLEKITIKEDKRELHDFSLAESLFTKGI